MKILNPERTFVSFAQNVIKIHSEIPDEYGGMWNKNEADHMVGLILSLILHLSLQLSEIK